MKYNKLVKEIESRGFVKQSGQTGSHKTWLYNNQNTGPDSYIRLAYHNLSTNVPSYIIAQINKKLRALGLSSISGA